MLNFVSFIKSLLPPYIIDNDSYKDNDGKGFIERYLEIFGGELDDEVYNKIDFTDIVDIDLTDEDYLSYIGYTIGNWEDFSSSTTHYRNILKFLVSLFQIKGTKQSLISILYSLGMVTTVTEEVRDETYYDDGSLYDDGEFYDNYCHMCSFYDLTITGPTITGELYEKIARLEKLVNPIFAQRQDMTYNGSVITESLIEVWVDENGDLNYNNDADPGLILSLDANGDLIIDGPNASRYYVNDDGDLIYLLY